MTTGKLLLRLKSFGFLFICFFLSATALSQTAILRGTVKDVNGLPLAGASVILDGTRRGTVSDASGNYELKVAPGTYTLVISYVGVVTQRKQITATANMVSENNFDMQNSGELNRIIVVGSRSATNRSSTQTPVPVDVITGRELTLTGQVEPTQMINFVAPSYNSSRQTVADGTDHIDPATIRGLGPDQTLVLVNGKRRYNTALLNVNGTIGRGSVGTDLNAIPAAAIERVEVLRDGASSQYGSDAIAGVINVVLKKNSSGTSLYGHWGKTYEGDGEVQQIGLNKGFSLGNQGGYLNISGDIRHRDPTNRSGNYTGTVYTNNVALDEQLIAQRGFSRKNNMHIGNSEVYNYGGLINMGLPLAKNVQFLLTAGVNYRDGKAAGFYRYPKQTSQVIAELWPDGFLPEINSIIRDRYLTAGLEGKFAGSWNWDLSQAIGGNSFRFDITNSNNASQYALKETAPTEFYAGKLRFNQYTSNLNISRDFGAQLGLKSFNVALGGEFRKDNYGIHEGEPASYLNYDPASGRVGGAQVFPGFQPSNAVDAKRNVFGGYADIETDITDKLLLNGAGRYEHYSDYGSSVAGKLAIRYQVIKPVAVRAAVSNGFRAPSMHQRYFSAISTVFIQTSQGLQPFQQGTFRNNSLVAGAFGIPGLDAEKSTNYSVGLTSRLIKNKMAITIDGYLIDIDDRIVLSSSFRRFDAPEANAVNTILNQYPDLSDVSAVIFFTNAIDTRTKGIDAIISFADKLGAGTLAITGAANINKTEVLGDARVSTITDATLQARLFARDEKGRYEEAQPRHKISVNLNYRIGKWTFNARSTSFGKVATRDPGNPALDEFFSEKMVTDASMSYKVKNFASITIGANNIGNVYPDKLKNFGNTGEGRFVYSRNATQFGFNGGYYYTSLVLELHNLKFNTKEKISGAAPTVPMMEVQQ
ncbi:MAG TPA: TonB-dependent receptor [Chitinophagaceae bacterium]|nr:TonB-dependent receptor [Chitinophagaceae bacterium]